MKHFVVSINLHFLCGALLGWQQLRHRKLRCVTIGYELLRSYTVSYV